MNDYVIGAAAAVALAVLVLVWVMAGWLPAAVLVALGLLTFIAAMTVRIARRRSPVEG